MGSAILAARAAALVVFMIKRVFVNVLFHAENKPNEEHEQDQTIANQTQQCSLRPHFHKPNQQPAAQPTLHKRVSKENIVFSALIRAPLSRPQRKVTEAHTTNKLKPSPR
jgi:hypothetical protein